MNNFHKKNWIEFELFSKNPADKFILVVWKKMETDPTFVEYTNTSVSNGNANILLSKNTLSIVF